ncbi:low molecular weight phosphatase family protein [Microbacterium sp. CFBP9023]|uniref:arsenate-mycothiol transferase ArsC n=1 Tax=Microbacterium sp. CFBP9023 TaxID=3096535 RepID=UPI002A69EAA7|nr:low molecular weight phosphatase family protein [Microbacterium sp. CFBP9023]MDY0984066.1 low molecular weight phosphatase family protein [Microbacterium sp. CFBP9023]
MAHRSCRWSNRDSQEARGPQITQPKTVLFICKHNAGRSQLGAHLLTHIGDERLVATSAGITPAATINPAVASTLHELGIDTSAATPRAVTVDDLNAADVVVLMKPGHCIRC